MVKSFKKMAYKNFNKGKTKTLTGKASKRMKARKKNLEKLISPSIPASTVVKRVILQLSARKPRMKRDKLLSPRKEVGQTHQTLRKKSTML